MSQLKELLGDSVIYGIGSFALKATQIIILPLIMYFLKTDEFGKLDYFLNIKNILIIIYGYGILTSIFKYSDYKLKVDKSPFNGFLVVLLVVILSTLCLAGLIIFVPYIGTYAEDLIYVQLISSFGAFLTIPLGVLRQRKMPKSYILVNFIYVSFFLSISYILIIYTDLKYQSVLIAHSTASIFAFVFGVLLVKNYVEFSYSFSLFKKMFNFGFSIALNSLSFIFIFAMTRFVLKTSGTFEDIGILGMATRLSLFVGALLIAPFNLAWLPFVSSNVDKKGFDKTLNNVFRIFTWVGLFFCFTLEFIINDLFLLINNTEYLPSIQHILPFSLSHFFLGYYFIFASGIYLSGDIKKYKIIAIITIFVNLFLYLVFFNSIDIFTVSYITLFSFVFSSSLAFYYGNKTLKIKIFKPLNIFYFLMYLFFIIIIKMLPESVSFSPFLFRIKIVILLFLFFIHVLVERKILNK
jgi:O-antigen/teichoic acid export membrane protein